MKYIKRILIILSAPIWFPLILIIYVLVLIALFIGAIIETPIRYVLTSNGESWCEDAFNDLLPF